MPIYTYKCVICDRVTDQYNTIAERKSSPACECGHATELVIMSTQIAPILGGGDFQGYKCPVTDEWVTSRRQRRNIMAEHNLIETGDRGKSRGRMASGFYQGESRPASDDVRIDLNEL